MPVLKKASVLFSAAPHYQIIGGASSFTGLYFQTFSLYFIFWFSFEMMNTTLLGCNEEDQSWKFVKRKTVERIGPILLERMGP